MQTDLKEAGSGRTKHFIAEEGETFDPIPSPAKMDWLPLAPGRYVDLPIGASDGNSYLALLYEADIAHQVKWLLTAKALRPHSMERAEIEKAIAHLQAALGDAKG